MTQWALMPQTRVGRLDGDLVIRRADAARVLSGTAGVALIDGLLAAARDGRIDLPEPDDEEARTALDSLRRLLEDAALICPAEVAEHDPTLRNLWMRIGREEPIDVLAARRDRAAVTLAGHSPLASRIASGLREAGVAVRLGAPDTGTDPDADAVPDLLIVVADDVDAPELAEANRWALDRRVPWMPVVEDDGARLLVGPYLVPHSSACWQCVRLRRSASFADRDLARRLPDLDPLPARPGPAGSIGLEMVAAGLVAEKAVERLVVGDRAAMTRPGSMAAVVAGGPGLRIEEHMVLRVPRCPACSPAARRGQPQVWFHGGRDS